MQAYVEAVFRIVENVVSGIAGHTHVCAHPEVEVSFAVLAAGGDGAYAGYCHMACGDVYLGRCGIVPVSYGFAFKGRCAYRRKAVYLRGLFDDGGIVFDDGYFAAQRVVALCDSGDGQH